MRTTLVTRNTVRKKAKTKAVHEGEAAMEEAMAPQLRFLAMSRAQRAKAFLAESKVMARFYAAHTEEGLPDIYDDPQAESKAG